MLRFFTALLFSLLICQQCLYAQNMHKGKDSRHERLRHVGSLDRFIAENVYTLNLTPLQKKKIDSYVSDFKKFRRKKLDEYRNNFDKDDFVHNRKKKRKMFFKAKQKLRNNIRSVLNDEQKVILKEQIKTFKKFRKRHHDSRCDDRR